MTDQPLPETRDAPAPPTDPAALAAAFAPDGIVVLDANGFVEWVNPAFEALTGLAADEMVGHAPALFLQGPDADLPARLALRNAVSAGHAATVELRNYHRNGDLISMEVVMTPVLGATGELERFVATIRDTSSRQRRKSEAESRGQLAQALVDASSAGIWIAEPVRDDDGEVVDFRWVDVNPAAELLLRHGRDELVGAAMLDLFPGARETGVFDRYVEVVSTGREANFDVRYAFDWLDAWYRVTALLTPTGHLAVSFFDVSAEKVAFEDLQRAKQDLYDLASQVPGALVAITLKADLSLELANASDAMSDLAGYDVRAQGLAPALSRMNALDMVPALARLREAPKEPALVRFRYAHPARGERWIELFARLDRLPNDDVRIAAYAHDVTDTHLARHRAEQASEAARAAGNRLAKLADTVPGVLFQTQFAADGAISHPYVSRRTRDLFGFEPDELQRAPERRFERILEEDRASYLSLLRNAIEDGQPFSTTVRIKHPERGEIAVRILGQPERLADGSTLVHKFATDVTDMFLKEQELRAAKDDAESLGRRLSLAASAGDIGFWEYHPATGQLRWDDGMFALFGVDRANSTGGYADWERAVHPDDVAGASAVLSNAIEKREPLSIRFRIVRPGGVVRHIVGRAIPVRTGDDLAMLGVNWDVTEFIEAQERADAGARAQAAFLANMSHEIRTPMNGVIGVASALASTALTPQQREMVDLILTSGDTLDRLLSDILDMARIEEGKVALQCAPFDLRDAVETAAQLMQMRAESKSLSFDVTYGDAAIGWFEGDVVRIRQILSNLLANAIKFTERGGVSLDIDVADGDGGDCELRIAVTDTGIGFTEEVRARLFARFEQADASITRTFGGSGLGLAICKSLCVAMGGEIWAESAPGAGARFEVRLPLVRVAAPASISETAPALSAVKGDFEGMRALLAEDHPTNQRVMELMLAPLGIAVTVTSNGAEAVEAFEAQSFDIVLMDMQMPVMDGLSATRAIRDIEAREQRPATPIVMLSANALREHEDQSRAAGCDLHVAKPVTPDRLFVALAAAATVRAERNAA
ncbi:MAG: PAS domain-containing protein [Alphaproteobacteria bacterium]|nr:PAS domain-containing protein [Alphaproteobacteria bacterium]